MPTNKKPPKATTPTKKRDQVVFLMLKKPAYRQLVITKTVKKLFE